MATPTNTQAPEKLEEFDVYRKQATQRANAQAQGQQDALKRRFAAMGGINSGAFLKQQQLAQQAANQQAEQSIQGIDAAERQELSRRKEVQEGRDFQAGEAEKQRGFLSNESRLGREFSSLEADKQRGFMRDESEIARKFAASEADKQRDFQGYWAKQDANFKNRVFDADQGSRLAQMNLAERQFKLDEETTAFNKKMAEWEMGQAGKSFVEDLLGEGGLVGAVGDLFGRGGVSQMRGNLGRLGGIGGAGNMSSYGSAISRRLGR